MPQSCLKNKEQLYHLVAWVNILLNKRLKETGRQSTGLGRQLNLENNASKLLIILSKRPAFTPNLGTIPPI